jgi:hypothetical protein
MIYLAPTYCPNSKCDPCPVGDVEVEGTDLSTGSPCIYVEFTGFIPPGTTPAFPISFNFIAWGYLYSQSTPIKSTLFLSGTTSSANPYAAYIPLPRQQILPSNTYKPGQGGGGQESGRGWDLFFKNLNDSRAVIPATTINLYRNGVSIGSTVVIYEPSHPS